METGHFGDLSPVGEGVSELRIFCGLSYRVYFVEQGDVLVILLSGGDKSTQKTDIIKTKGLAKKLG